MYKTFTLIIYKLKYNHWEKSTVSDASTWSMQNEDIDTFDSLSELHLSITF